ncbi:MAG: hypothetical protein JW864_06445 [Spirochaetes bacterium]|nr:hypothetical protein [Spirochaetota bacterium]
MIFNDENNENEKYRQDINTIKNILIKVDEKPIYENWVFSTAGILFIIGSIIHYIYYKLQSGTLTDSFFRIWIPVILLMLFLEPVALVRKMAKEALPVFSKTIIKFYIGLCGISAASVFLCVIIIKAGLIGLLPVCILSLWAVFYFYISQMAYTHFTLHGYLLIAIAIIFYNIQTSIEIQIILAGLILGLSMIVAGITEMTKEKKKNEQ